MHNLVIDPNKMALGKLGPESDFQSDPLVMEHSKQYLESFSPPHGLPQSYNNVFSAQRLDALRCAVIIKLPRYNLEGSSFPVWLMGLWICVFSHIGIHSVMKARGLLGDYKCCMIICM